MPKGNKSLNLRTININDFKDYYCSRLNTNYAFNETDYDIKSFLLNRSDEEVGQILDVLDADLSEGNGKCNLPVEICQI